MPTKKRFRCLSTAIVWLLLATVIMGCSIGKDNVLFVTTTSLGVDFDTTPPVASIAYNRVEGFFGPRYENGAVPPVMARIQSDGSIFNAKVRQLYATGAASTIVVSPQAKPGPTDLKGDKKVMFYGTVTTTGLKVGFDGAVPDSFLFGYKRKESSLIPLGHDQDKKVDIYPSVIATIDTTAQASSDRKAGLQGGQFFATGETADALAKDPAVQEMFENAKEDAFRAYSEAVAEQDKESARILRCYSGVKVSDLPEVWKDADEAGLFREKDSLEKILDLYNAAMTPGVDVSVHDENLRKAHRRYSTDITITEGSTPLRITNLSKHRVKVCAISKR